MNNKKKIIYISLCLLFGAIGLSLIIINLTTTTKSMNLGVVVLGISLFGLIYQLPRFGQ